MTWLDDYEARVGDVKFLVKVSPQEREDFYTLLDRPPCTNMSNKPMLYGWCGSTNNVSIYGKGMCRVTKVTAAGRALVERLEDDELADALEAAGWPELIPEEVT